MKSNDILKTSFGQAATGMFDISTSKDPDTPQAKKGLLKLYAAIIIVIFFTGFEIVPVLFRRDFKVDFSRLVRILLGFAAFITIGIVMILDESNSNNSDISFVLGCFYIVLAIYILWNGIVQFKNTRSSRPRDLSENGRSTLLSFLVSNSKDVNMVQNLAEPLFLFAIGSFIFAFDELGGLALVICAVSYWLRLFYKYLTSLVSSLKADPVKTGNRVS